MDHQHSEHPGTHPLADEGPDEFDGESGGEAERGGERESAPGRWASWLVVAVSAVPPLALAVLGRRFLGGGADAAYVGTRAAPGDGDGIDLGWSNRFGLLWMTVPVPQVLLAALCGVLVVAALVVAGRPDWLVPRRWAARVGAGAAALTALESLVSLVSLVTRAGEPERESFGGSQISYYIPSTGEFPELLGVLALLVVTTALPALAALVLWRAVDPTAGPVPAAPAEPAAPTAVDGEPEPAAEPAPDPAPAPQAGVADVPKPSADDLDAYRRPVSGEGA